MKKSKLTDTEILALFQADTRINKISELAGVSRQSVYAALKRTGKYDANSGSKEMVCRFCGERYREWRNRIKKAAEGDQKWFGYCSVQCFHASRSLSGEYSKVGGSLSRIDPEYRNTARHLGRLARATIKQSGIKLLPGQVVHHIDGDRSNNNIKNLRIFNSHTEHMQFHHSLRGKPGTGKLKEATCTE